MCVWESEEGDGRVERMRGSEGGRFKEIRVDQNRQSLAGL